MSLLNAHPAWQRHMFIEQAVLAFHDLQLRFPTAARMVETGAVNTQPNLNTDPLPLDEEAEIEAWRIVIRAYASIISQIYYASRNTGGKQESTEAAQLRFHGDKAINMIVGRSWKSLKRFSQYVFPDSDLEAQITNLIEKMSDLDERIQLFVSNDAESTHA